MPFIILPIIIHQNFGVITFFILKLWSKIFSILNFIHYDIIGKEKISDNESTIYICNHTSYLDIPGLMLSIPNQVRLLAKKELLKIPIFSLIINLVCVMVDRSDMQSRKKSLDKLKEKLQHNISILIFPEGTQNRGHEILQPFHNGAFRTAIETNINIRPIVIINAGKLMPPNKLRISPGKIKIVIGDLIKIKDYENNSPNELKNATFNTMRKMIIKHTDT